MSPDTTLNLGDFQFALFEIPDRIEWGGSQRIAIHELVGGKRVIDAMGRADRALEWSGLFTGQNSTERARYLDTLRASGKPQALTFGQLSYSVIVRDFDASYERYYQIPYRISCEVIADLANPVTSVAPASIDSDILTDYDVAVGLADDVGDDSLTALLATVGASISLVASFSNASRSQCASVSQPLALAQLRIQALLGSSDAELAGVSTFGGVVPGASLGISAAALVGQSSNMMQMNALLQLNAVTGRMSANLGAIFISPNQAIMAGGNLFGLAQQKYGDASAWTGIAKANNLTDPFIQGVQTLNIPASPDRSGGILDA
jgi:hypothetical protein